MKDNPGVLPVLGGKPTNQTNLGTICEELLATSLPCQPHCCPATACLPAVPLPAPLQCPGQLSSGVVPAKTIHGPSAALACAGRGQGESFSSHWATFPCRTTQSSAPEKAQPSYKHTIPSLLHVYCILLFIPCIPCIAIIYSPKERKF